MAKKKKEPANGNGKPALEIKDVQAIKYLRANLEGPGGVVVATGRHGSGKSTSIRCAAALTDPEVRKDLRPRDGCEYGTIEAPGILVRIGRRNTASGELEWSVVDSECDPSVLVNPGIKDKAIADAHRLRMLVRIGKVEVSPEQWGCHLVDVLDGDQVSRVVTGLDPKNPVGSAEIVRERVHEMALTQERAWEHQNAKAASLVQQCAGVDLTAPSDATALQAASEAALRGWLKLQADAEAATKARAAVEDAKQKLCSVEAGLPDLAAITAEREQAEADRKSATTEVASIDAQIRDLQTRRTAELARIDRATAASTAAAKRLADGKRQHESVATLRATVQSSVPVGPTAEEVGAAWSAKEAAAAAILRGEQVRQAQEVARQANAAKEAAKRSEEWAKQLRILARSTDIVLEEALRAAGFLGLMWRDCRLYVESDRGLQGRWELFDELSEGERYQRAFRWLSQKLPPSSFVPLSQEAWQGLLDELRVEIAEQCRENRLWVLTGQIGDGELRPEVFGAEGLELPVPSAAAVDQALAEPVGVAYPLFQEN